MKNLTFMLGNVLEAVSECYIDEQTGMNLSEEAKQLISDFANHARNTEIYKQNELTGRNFTNGMTVEEMWIHMNQKILDAPTMYHMVSAGILIVPFVDELIKEDAWTT